MHDSAKKIKATGIQPFNPIQIPLLNTAILLASGVTVTRAHHGLLENNATQATQGLFFTVLLGLYFTALQAYEYFEAPFTIADSAYGFCSNRIPRTTCNYWSNIPNHMLTTTHNFTFLTKSPLRICSNNGTVGDRLYIFKHTVACYVRAVH